MIIALLLSVFVSIALLDAFSTITPFSPPGDGGDDCGQALRFLPENFAMDGGRLVGGRDSLPNAWPWTTQLLWNGVHRCGAALIDHQLVITAAHCFAKSRQAAQYSVLLGGHAIGSGSRFAVVNISIHPLFNRVFPSSYDAALLRINPSVNYTKTVKPVCLPISSPPNNQMCVVTGWGHLAEEGQRRPTVLNEIHVPIIPTAQCNNPWHYSGRLHAASMFCAGYQRGKVDACQGDSGGPLVCERMGKWELQGLVSWGIGCARPNAPGVYTKVSAIVPWIRSQSAFLLSTAP